MVGFEKKFVIGIVDHPLFGLIMTPYIVIIKPNHGFLQIEAKITQLNVSKYINSFSEDEKELIKLIDEYSDQTLHKIFSKKRGQTTVDFVNNLSKEYAEKNIRPYIERRLIKCTSLLQKIDINLYFKEKPKYINSDDKIEVIKGTPEAIFNIEKHKEETRYYLTIKHNKKEISLLGKAFQIITEDPCRIIIDNKLYIFDNINAKKLLPFFNKECIHIPKSSEKKWMNTFAKETIKQYNVNARGFDIKETISEKHAVLRFEKSLNGDPVLILLFIYNNELEFFSNKGPLSSVKLEKKNDYYTFYKTKRDSEWENEIATKLERIGLYNTRESHFVPQKIMGSEKENMLYKFVLWISQYKDKITSEGVILTQNIHNTSYSLDVPEIKSSIKEDIDWFDIYITVQIGDYTIPFTKFRKNILTGTREYVLPDGKIAILPEEWFEQYKELFQYGHSADKHIHLSKHHFVLIETSIPEKSKSIIEKYKNLVSEINTKEYNLPEGLNAQLRPYQVEGFSWMQFLQEHNFGGCLADDMGLGKTIQTLALLLNSKREYNGGYSTQSKPVIKQLSIFEQVETKQTPFTTTSLIIMPTSLIHNWEKEIKKFTPELTIYKHIGQNRTKEIHLFSSFDIILTTYGIVRNDIDLLKTFGFYNVILDESQYIKNPESKIYKTVNQLESKHRFVLTGTPIENSLIDLWAQINFLNKGLLGNLQFFKREYANPIEKNADPEKKEKLQQFIQPFVLRRTKHQVAKDLPDKFESIIYCDMSEEQKSYYESEKSKIRNSIIEKIEKTEKKPTILAIEGLNKLRQIANHPVLIDNSYKADSGKFEEITRNIENLIAENHKVLVFSAYVKHLNLLANYLNKQKYSYSMLTGSTQNREQVINEFQDTNDKNIFLIQIKAGGVGLNLTIADYVFIIDPWWNPAVEEQAINRTHRIGQDKKVIVYRFISADSVEEKIQELKARKSRLADSFISTEQAVQKISIDKILEFLS